ncbi:hypothetical protein [Acidianus bottle-shaped virus 3 strain ABV3]|uniref:Uncharacterized protein n=1 Tax=Acidianus bottle-shaped virus 3 strain ABV3 TaxID=1732174 RepID=A0A0N9P4I4_9VIRU|nr:hypothetical protein AVU00_gp08 [Acidianus bottle-shaped virus 3 strain ABV3]ALG96810.1 hypothetical protein [Acidianus bottle-shaped virus 3 strain ABV3]
MKTSLFIKNLPEILWHTRLTYVVNENPDKLKELLKKVYKAQEEDGVLKIGLRTIKIDSFSAKKSLVKIF